MVRPPSYTCVSGPLRSLLTRRTLIVTPEIEQCISSILKPTLTVLTPAETAFAHRLGLQTIPAECFKAALAHPKLPISNRPAGFLSLMRTGQAVLSLLTEDYIAARFPRLPHDSRALALQVYTTDRNLCAVARSAGIEYAVINFTGIPRIQMPTLEAHCNRRGKQSSTRRGEGEGEDEENSTRVIHPTVIYAEIFRALIGISFTERGALSTRNFLDSILFSATFNKNLLCQPRNPMLKLARALMALDQVEPQYRLLHETGRLSGGAAFVVGVYSGAHKIAESDGPSLLVAQERAAMAALRDLFLVDTPRAPRPILTDKIRSLPLLSAALRGEK